MTGTIAAQSAPADCRFVGNVATCIGNLTGGVQLLDGFNGSGSSRVRVNTLNVEDLTAIVIGKGNRGISIKWAGSDGAKDGDDGGEGTFAKLSFTGGEFGIAGAQKKLTRGAVA